MKHKKNSILKQPFTAHKRHRTGGFSIIELMVAMAIALILLLGLTVMFINATGNFRELSNTSRQLENGRYALNFVREDLRHAGFYGEWILGNAPNNFLDACNITGNALNDLRATITGLYIQGYSEAASNIPTCLVNHLPGTDALLVLRASTSIDGLNGDTTNLNSDTIYLQTLHDIFVLARGSQATNFNLERDPSGLPAPHIRRVLAHLYYIRTCNICNDGGDGIPTLVRRELDINGNITTVPLAEGIEQLYLRYGVDENGNGNPENYLAAAHADLSDPADWQSIVAVEVNLLARSPDPSRNYVDQRSYTLGDLNIPATNDEFKRQPFTSVVRMENIGQRRDQ